MTKRPRPARRSPLLVAVLAIVACSSGNPALGAVRVRLVTRTDQTFVAEGEVTYDASSATDLVRDVTCIAFPEGELPEGANVRASPATLSGKQTFPVPKQPDGVTNGRLDFALSASGGTGKYEVLCGATSESGAVSAVDPRTSIAVP